MSQLTPEEKKVARQVLEGLLIKHAATKWNRPGAAAMDAPAASKAPLPVASTTTPIAAGSKRKPAKEAAR